MSEKEERERGRGDVFDILDERQKYEMAAKQRDFLFIWLSMMMMMLMRK